MSVGLYSLIDDTNVSSNCGSNGFTEVRRLPATQVNSWEFRRHAQEGSVMPNALVACDVDGDGVAEIVFGTTGGQILVVKADHRIPIYSRTLTATISIVLYSVAYRRLVVLTLEGQCEVTEGFLVGGCRPAPPASSTSGQSKRQLDVVSTLSVDTSSHLTNYVTGQDEGIKVNNTSFMSSHVFCVAPNCTCGDITAEEGATTVFLGSENCIYAYSLTPDGECLGSLFLQAPVTSMRCFTVPFATEGYLHVLNPPPLQFSKNTAATTQTPLRDFFSGNGEVCGGIPQQPMEGATLLLLSCQEQLVLLNASTSSVRAWGVSGRSRCVAMLEEAAADSIGKVTGRDACMASCSSAHCTEVLFSDYAANAETTLLQPLWQCWMSRLSELQQQPRPQTFSLDEGRVQSWKRKASPEGGTVPVSDIVNAVARDEAGLSPSKQIVRRSLGTSVVAGGASHRREDSEMPLDVLEHGLQLSFAVDVAVGRDKLQFAVVGEDGRWFILEMSPAYNSSLTEAVRTVSSTAPDKTATHEAPIKWVKASILCIASGNLKPQWMLQCFCYYCVENDEFCSVFFSTEGTCYLVNGNSKTCIESYLKADAMSCAIVKGGVMGNPMHPCWAPSSRAATSMPTGVSAASLQPQSRLGCCCGCNCGSVETCNNRNIFLVCLTMDEIVLSSVGGESFLSAQQCSGHRTGAGEQTWKSSGPVAIAHAANMAAAGGMMHGRSEVCGVCGIPTEGGVHVGDDVDGEDEREEELMLELGTALLEAEGCADPATLFSPEERRFVARKLCVAGYTPHEWDLLQQMHAELSE
ncbi:putative FG-GAP repeat protein [Trypanosoma rangeli]|uniref:Putative FG-GAP repeat protein n=1 Tax=Trypanosoma rangeli TaxID=5698 RepID=A0A3R7MNF3_TRYRA|nr:putative FG-GAP repeat protein [Trypanosoma rangeli]RNF05682.1 putative FG-GAP repeat protein [Trypanosoma rangeli]|eukprot:RNF05682.1 putative FG-GAP repeat protein [Trypanosoma rangeli]